MWPLAGLLDYPRFAAHSLDAFDAVLDASERLARERFAPHNRAADLYRSDLHGHHLRRLTTDPANDITPDWGPTRQH